MPAEGLIQNPSLIIQITSYQQLFYTLEFLKSILFHVCLLAAVVADRNRCISVFWWVQLSEVVSQYGYQKGRGENEAVGPLPPTAQFPPGRRMLGAAIPELQIGFGTVFLLD